METIAGLFPQIFVKFLPVLIFSNQEFDSRFDPARQRSAVATRFRFPVSLPHPPRAAEEEQEAGGIGFGLGDGDDVVAI